MPPSTAMQAVPRARDARLVPNMATRAHTARFLWSAIENDRHLLCHTPPAQMISSC